MDSFRILKGIVAATEWEPSDSGKESLQPANGTVAAAEWNPYGR